MSAPNSAYSILLLSILASDLQAVQEELADVLADELGEGATEADLLDAYPQLKREGIQAATAYGIGVRVL